mmetsp:Transcript_71047/g.179297  ORF Transcript_71047/g.179297 Transcript_71047/m.179297 type:complete len:494 (+) Transcript_71047:145-1626(+)
MIASLSGYGTTVSTLSKTDGCVAKEPVHHDLACQNGSRSRAIAFACLLWALIMSEGYDFGVLNGAIVRIKEDLQCSAFEISLLVAVTPLSVIPGSLIGGALADWVGRWRSLLFCCMVLAAGPLGMACCSSKVALFAFRALVGTGIGAGLVVVSMYLAEVSPTDLRGRLTLLEDVGLTVGMLLGYFANLLLLGMEDDWRWMLGLGAVVPLAVLSMLFLPLVPESPRWLFAVGKEDSAEETLMAFVGRAEAQRSIAAMRAQQREVEERRQQAAGGKSSGSPQLSDWSSSVGDLRRSAGLRRMLTAGSAVCIGQTACGYLAIAYYSSSMLKDSIGERRAFMATISMGVAKLLVEVVVVLVLEQVGRRPLLLASAAATTAASAWLAFAFMFSLGAMEQALGFLLFMAGFSLGLGPICLVYIAEVFPTEWRAKGMSIVLFLSRSVGVASTVAFPLLIEYVGAGRTFMLQVAVNVALFIALWRVVYETGGQSLEELAKV